MPATSEAQRNLFAMALAIKKDKKPQSVMPGGTPSQRIARALSAPKIKEFLVTKGLNK